MNRYITIIGIVVFVLAGIFDLLGVAGGSAIDLLQSAGGIVIGAGVLTGY